MAFLRQLEDIVVSDPFIVSTAEGHWLFLRQKKNEGEVSEHVDVCFSADGKEWSEPVPALSLPEPGRTYWAPEVHAWRGAWYMFVTVTGTVPGCGLDTPLGHERTRGTYIFRSEQVQGPYQPWSDGPIPPLDHLTLDGTFYVSPQGVPYMIYCHEWVQVRDGTVEAVALTEDLKRAAGDPFLLFRASEAAWAKGMYVDTEFGIKYDGTCWVTDGVFPFRDASGALCLLWSTMNENYQTGLARSASGNLKGPWKHADQPLFVKGGHPMLLQNRLGEWQMLLHTDDGHRVRKARLVSVNLTQNGLTIDLERTPSLACDDK